MKAHSKYPYIEPNSDLFHIKNLLKFFQKIQRFPVQILSKFILKVKLFGTVPSFRPNQEDETFSNLVFLLFEINFKIFFQIFFFEQN